ncbi:hypothetical protein [Flagellimonas flava]|uniref:DUF5723 domain-containing protein n=1 Tax=Flagellimonas flava TaxID=570519 RepID=A0A1M5M2A4_9FLAO|nr:hypothetical protein [Allomuricauda flava]SHG71039.1 hypothetical protein SAMN04488116_2209 [Allomuricauda flava]
MNFKIFTLGLLFFITTQINAQSYSGFLADNYNGVHGVLQNPANIADSRLKLDLNLFGISTFFGNNYLGIRLDDAFSNVGSVFDTAEQTPKRDNFLSANLDILGPSIMLGINKKSAVALFTRGRFFFNADDIDGTLLDKEGG